MAAQNGTTPPVVVTPAEIAAMLRKSADIVERNEFHPILYQTMKVLTAYAGDYVDNASIGNASGANKATAVGSDQNKSVFHDVPDSVLDGPGPTSTTSSTIHHNRNASNASSAAGRPQSGGQYSTNNSAAVTSNISSGNSVSGASTVTSASKPKTAFSLKGIRKGLQKIGGDISELMEGHGKDDNAPFDENAWCEECFTRGCGCKQLRNKLADAATHQQNQSNTSAPLTNNSDHDKSSQPVKPCFQRPINPSSNLIANGWIDQQRRSKMRVVWKDVLASLVEGRRPGEETTLWIQRQVVDSATGKVTGLEALHQVPMKWLEDVNYVDIYGDHRFTLKVYNIAEEFYFRTRDEQSAQSWVLTLRSARDASLESVRMGNAGAAGHSKPSTKEVGGMGLNNLEDWDNNGVGKPVQQQPHTSDETSNRPSSAPTQTQSQTTPRLTISELRSVAHGAGYDTWGMERQDLERIAAMIRNQATAGTAQTSTSPSSAQEQLEARAMAEAARCQKEVEELMKQEEEAKLRKATELEQRRRREEENRKLQAEQKQAAEMRKKQEEEEHRRRQEEERQRQVELQAAQIKQRQEEERRKRVAELQAAEMKRNEEERRKQQQNYYQQQQQHAHYQQQQQQQQAHFQQQQQQNPAHNQQFYNQHTQQGLSGHQQPQPTQPSRQQYYNQNAPSSGGYPQQGFQGHPPNNQQRPQPQQQAQQKQQKPQQQHQTASPSKYMEDNDDEAQSAAILKIKRNILIHWALQPPNLNVLRPIDQLITTIHTAMPPAYGISKHEYFSKFTPITRHEVIASDAMGNHPDETKLKKAVRKVRVFLHPDKLPRDLSAEQSFMARMLWDITSDSWEEFLKHKDELDWIRG